MSDPPQKHLDVLLWLERRARSGPDNVAVECLDEPAGGCAQLTFDELAMSVGVAATRLQQQLPPGSVVLLCVSNSCEYVVAFLSVLAAGMTVFPVSPALRESERRALADQARAAAVIIDTRATAEPAPPGRPRLDVAELAAIGSRRAPALSSLEHRGAALYLQSSGTTGPPRIVRRSLTALDAVARNVATAVELTPDDRVLLTIPLCHSYGVENGVLAPILAGSRLVVGRGFDAAAVCGALDRGATVFPAVPFMFEALTELGLRRPPALRLPYSAGSRLPPELSAAFASLTGAPIGQVYGSTEVGSVTFDHPRHPGFDPRTVGLPLDGVVVRILPTGGGLERRPLPPGVEGEVAIAAPSMLEAYVGTEASPRCGGLFPMGDLGRLEPNGRLTITGRLKLQIDIAGQKINPTEVEEILATHPSVRECVVVALPVTETVNRLKAVVVPEPGGPPIDASTLRALARAHLSSFKVPRIIELRRELPRTATGKVIRSALVSSKT